MTKEKQTAGITKLVAGILAALMFGAFLGSPVPKVWAAQISDTVTVLSEKISKEEEVHSIETEASSTINEKVLAEKTTIQETAENTGKNDEAGSAVTESGANALLSDPPLEEQPDYICLGANRGGIADRKEMDVLIHLINAEAYGLSYKAKVAVGQVVMNRWVGPYYGDDLLAIMTAPYQFTPIYNGSAFEKQIEPDSIKAANAVLNGAGVDELTDDTYYFVNPDFTEDKTIEQKMVFVCEIEGLHFYKPPSR